METLEATLDALYASITFRRGEQPQLDILRELFVPEGLLINNNNPDEPSVMSVPDFCSIVQQAIASGAIEEFHEQEISHIIEVFGNIAHVFSAYEARFDAAAAEPFSIGINTIQLVRTRGKWRVTSMAWNDQTPTMKIPERYLPKKNGEEQKKSAAQ